MAFHWDRGVFSVAVFYFNLFSHANKGILVGATDLPNEKFPRKRYLLISSAISLAVSVGLWGTRIAVYAILGLDGDMTIAAAAIVMAILCTVTFTLLFMILYASYFFAYKIAEKQNKQDAG